MAGPFQYPKRKLRKMIKKGEYAEALEYGNSIESKYAEDHDFLFIMGSIYYIMEEPREAIRYLDQAVSMRHDDVEALMLMTNAYLSQEQRQEAISCCMHILKIDPGHTEAMSLLKELQD